MANITVRDTLKNVAQLLKHDDDEMDVVTMTSANGNAYDLEKLRELAVMVAGEITLNAKGAHAIPVFVPETNQSFKVSVDAVDAEYGFGTAITLHGVSYGVITSNNQLYFKADSATKGANPKSPEPDEAPVRQTARSPRTGTSEA